MKSGLLIVPCLSSLLFTSSVVLADIDWIGVAGAEFFDSRNWDDGIGPTANVAYEGNIIILDSSAVANGKLILASGYTMTVTNSTLDFIQDTPYTIEGDLLTDDDSTINLDNSTLTVQSIAFDTVLNLTGNSVVNFGGANNSVNGPEPSTPANNTRVNLGDGSQLTLINGNNGTGGATVGSRIYRTSSGTTFASDFASPPLTEFMLAGDQTPFTSPNDGPITITAINPNPTAFATLPDIIVGYRLVPPETNQVIWYPTYRSATDWQTDLEGSQIVRFGWAEITDVYLADLNGDGLSDKVMRQTAVNGTTDPSQVITAFTQEPPSGFSTTTSFEDPDGDIDVPFAFLSAADTKLVFGDLDGDGIDDAGVTLDGANPAVGRTAGQLVWGLWKSEGIIGISNDHGSAANFSQWSVFGDNDLGDLGQLGDFNGDGITDRLIYRPSTQQAYIDLSVAGSFGDGEADYGPINIGIAGDRLYVTDINGDGKDDLALARDTNLLPPPEQTEGLQTLYGYYNDGEGFSTLNGTSPDITDFWGAGEGLLFGNLTPLTPLPDVPPSFHITQITSAGPELDFSGIFLAPMAGSYGIQANRDLESPWQLMEVVVAPSAGATTFSISDAQLDSTFGPNNRPTLFIRVVDQP